MALISSRQTGSNEVLSTYGLGGLGRDYTSLATWEAATDNDLVTAQETQTLFVCADQLLYDDSVVMLGATTSEDYRRIIRGAYIDGASGKPEEMVGFEFDGGNITMSILESWVVLHDLNINNTVTTGGAGYAILLSTVPNSNLYVIGCCIKSTRPTNGFGIQSPSSGGNLYVVNSLIYDCTFYGISEQGGPPLYIFNCTFANNFRHIGVNVTGTENLVVNCLFYGSTDADTVGGRWDPDCINCATDQTSIGTMPGIHRVSQTFTFADTGVNDYHLVTGDTGALGYGIPMDAYPVFQFNDDVDRQEIQDWSIGYDSDGGFATPEPDCDCPGSFTEIGSANAALSYLGVGTISTFTSGSKQATLLQALFAPTRRQLQQAYRWEFCLRRIQFTSVDVDATAPAYDFPYRFALPTTCLQVWEVGSPHTGLRYRVENGFLLMEQSSADVLYSVEVTDPDAWSPAFRDALELKLASKMAMALLHKPQIMQMYEEMFQDKVAEAAFLNSIQSDDYSSFSSILSSARYGFSLRDIPLDLS